MISKYKNNTTLHKESEPMVTCACRQMPTRTWALRLLPLLAIAALLLTSITPALSQTETDYSGTYYIAIGGKTTQYDPDSPNNNFYLCPTEGWCFYDAVNNYTGTDNGKPFLTTYKCKTNGYHSGDPSDAVWIIQKPDPSQDYYYIIQKSTGRYLMGNGQISGAGIDRMRVHLEAVSDPNDLDDKALFKIETYSTYLVISCKSSDGWNDNNPNELHRWLTVNGDNNNYLTGQSGKTGGPGQYTNTAGIIGIFTKSDANAHFYLEDYIKRPNITYNANQIGISTVQSGVTLIYTTDGSTPAADNGTVVNASSVTFDPDDDVTVIKAVAVLNGELSKVATFTPIVLLGTTHKRLIQSQNNAWNTTDLHFYMIPGDVDGDDYTRVNTTSLFRPSMEWYFLNAGVDNNGAQFFYIVNNAENKYLHNNTVIRLDEFDQDNENEFKFKIVERPSPYAGTYNIIPYGLTSGNMYMNKSSANSSPNAIILSSSNDANSRWKFILPTDLDKTAPFTASDPTTGSYDYYKIGSVGSADYYIISGTPNATTEQGDASAMNWYFEVAQAATDGDWLTYYHIRNAVTGDYLYFTQNANNVGACLETRSSLDLSNADRYMFTWAKTAAATESYYIIPKLVKDITLNQFSSLQRDNAVLKTNPTRGIGNYAWTFTPSSYTCATPEITTPTIIDDGYVIAATESDAKIYYTFDDAGTTPVPNTLYTGPIVVSDRNVASATIRAIAKRNDDNSDKSTEATQTVNRVATPVINLEGGAVTFTCTTPGVDFYYVISSSTPSDPTTGSNHYEAPIDNAAGQYIKVIAVKAGWINSEVATSSQIEFPCATPVIRKTSATTFTIECSYPTSEVHIRYTTDGTEPTTSTGTPYNGPVTFSASELPFTVKAIAYATNYSSSEIASKQITAGLTPVDGYFEIASDDDFSTFISMMTDDPANATANYKITADIDASGTSAISQAFSGILMADPKADGSLPVITGLTHAIFETVNGGTVKNIILDNVAISGGTNVGAICNEATGDSRIYNCGVLATGSTPTTGSDGYTTLTNCSSTISGSGYVGGIVGLLDGTSRVINCFSYANITGGDLVGGIVGKNNYATKANDLKTMVMNCMFYGDISYNSCISVAPIYNGLLITNDGDDNDGGVNNFNYFRAEASYVQDRKINVYNCALAAETRFLQRFEFFRHILNSNRAMAAWWITGNRADTAVVMKWVMEPSQIGTTTPYPILKRWGKYPSVVNYIPSNVAIDAKNEHRNEGRKLGTLEVQIEMGSGGERFTPPSGAAINNVSSSITLTVTDKDPAHFNFNYGKVQLPYYNDVGTLNYTGNRVVTGWKITSIQGGTPGSYTTGEDVTIDGSGNITATPYNFADRHCTNKDLYSVSHRVFNQGAYWDVPEGVTRITIQPYWAKAAYCADANADVVYKNSGADAMVTPTGYNSVGGGAIFTNGNTYSINGSSQTVYTSIPNAVTNLAPNKDHTVFDYAVVLVGNTHRIGISNGSLPYTIMSADFDNDNEPDYCYILRFNGRCQLHPVRVDFITVPGIGMAQKVNGGTGTYNFGIMQPLGWFETTNTSLFRETQFEYDNTSRTAQPLILQGGVMEQWVSGQSNGHSDNTTYFHVGGNVWFKEFHRGSHQDNNYEAKHPPLSVTGGDYDQFHLTGLYRSEVNNYDDNAECYINGGRFGVVAGTGMDGIGDRANHTNGDITWIIDHADIDEFYAGSFNAAKPAEGSIKTIISNSYVRLFYGGPKFGDLNEGRTVTTTATNCRFGKYFGAGYGGNSYNREIPFNANNVMNINWNKWIAGDTIMGNSGQGQNSGYNGYKQDYKLAFDGVSTQISYQFIPMSSNIDNVARLWIEYVKFSLATTRGVTSTLTKCVIDTNFYGGGSLGKVDGNVVSTLDSCIVKGNVFGAGYSATCPPVEVMNTGGFITPPHYDQNLGTYLNAVFPATVTYTWEKSATVDNTANAINKDDHILYTTEDLDALGTVEGNVTLTLKGNTIVGTLLNEGTENEILKPGTGNVYGGGDESAVTADSEDLNVEHSGNTSVRLEGGVTVYGNVYGGGNRGAIARSSEVKIQDPQNNP